MKKCLIIDSIDKYNSLCNNRIGLRYTSKVIFVKDCIGIASVILGINFLEKVGVYYEIV